MSNLECIGFVGELEQVSAALESAISRATPAPSPSPSRWWREPNGAAIAVHGKRAADCITPFFFAESPSLWEVTSSAPLLDQDCLHCSGVDVDLVDDTGTTLTRACVQLVEFAPYRHWLAAARRSATRVTERAAATVTGSVRAATRLSNSLTGDSFVQLTIDSYPSTLQLVAPAELCATPPIPGTLVEAAVWLVGRPTDPPPARRKLFGIF